MDEKDARLKLDEVIRELRGRRIDENEYQRLHQMSVQLINLVEWARLAHDRCAITDEQRELTAVNWRDYVVPENTLDFIHEEQVYCEVEDQEFEEARTKVLRKRKEFLEMYIERTGQTIKTKQSEQEDEEN